MNKRHVLLLTAALGMAPAQAQSANTTARPVVLGNTVKTAVTDPNLTDAAITVNTGSYVGPLSTLLAVIAKSARYEVVFNFNVDALALINGEIIRSNTAAAPATSPTTPGTSAVNANGISMSYATPLGKPSELPARPVVYNFVNKPFNQVWPLLMDVYDLQYEVITMGNSKVLRISQRPAQLAIPLQYITAKYAESKALEFFGQPSYSEIPIFDNTGKVVDKVRQFDKYVLVSGSMRILADDVNNRLIAGGTSEESAKIRSFISTIDVPRSASPVVPEGRAIYEVKGSAADINTVLKSQYPDLKVTPVGQSAQLIISGPKEQLDAALILLGKVDQATPSKDATVQKVFPLLNASAEELKATLEGTLARDLTQNTNLAANATLLDPVTGQPYVGKSVADAPMSQTAPTANSTATTANGATPATAAVTPPATIIADKRTNTLIVRGTQTQVDQIAELIPQLDKIVPQINVQVRIQEITETALKSLGIDWNVKFGGFNVSVGGGNGLSATFDPTRTLMGFNVFPTLNALENQSLAKKVYDGSITMQSGQRALGNNSPTQNSSSTAAATVKSGGRLDINIPSAAANVPAIQKTIDYGVVLDFFDPQVAPDGTITLRVRGQINDPVTNFPDNGVGVPNIIKFTNSEAQSIITFKSGQTVLLSGLMGSKTTNQNNGVPYLSTIPVVGGLFGSQSKKSEATQMLVVVTGTVVQ